MKNASMVLACCLVFLCRVANAEICWIEDVRYSVESQSKQGQIFIHFNNSPAAVSATVSPKAPATRYWISNAKISKVTNPYESQDSLLVYDGDSIFLSQGVHDTCTVKVFASPDHHGLEVEAWSQPHGFPASNVAKFIQASDAKNQ